MKVGDELIVLAWWNGRKPTKCVVSEIWSTTKELVTVKPLEGNPHARTIRLARDVHPSELERLGAAEGGTP